MGKNKGRNAFYFFMLDWRKEAEARGQRFPNGLKDVQSDPQCSEAWRCLTPQQKGPYHSLAKGSKYGAQEIDKKTSTGESIEQLERTQRKQDEYKQTMNEYIESIVSMGMHHNNLPDLKFIFIHVNTFCAEWRGDKKLYLPAEFAVSEFSLRNGTSNDIYHEIVSAKIPLGYMRQARETSEESHRIPIGLPCGESSFSAMYHKLVAFLEPRKVGNKFPLLYTSDRILEPVVSFLQRITEAVGEEVDKFLVYSAQTLFSKMRNAVLQLETGQVIDPTVTNNEFEKYVFLYNRGLECAFHKHLDDSAEYCSMTVVKQWAYAICDHCCGPLGVEMIQGVHCPKKFDPLNGDETDLDNEMSQLCLSYAGQPSLRSMTGVSQEHRWRASERTSEEEQRRRNECKPIMIIDHGKLNAEREAASATGNATTSQGSSRVVQRPLRAPTTTSFAMNDSLHDSPPAFNDDNFPAVGGRGISNRRRNRNTSPPLGLGRGCNLPLKDPWRKL